jgi:hypothetical protein
VVVMAVMCPQQFHDALEIKVRRWLCQESTPVGWRRFVDLGTAGILPAFFD